MSKLKAKELDKIGYIDNQARSLAINIANKYYKHSTKAELLTLLTEIKMNPDLYASDPFLGKIAATFMHFEPTVDFNVFELEHVAKPFKIYGGKHIEEIAKTQMETAMRLPIVVQGALMPDAHSGYGLPIGGVLATDNVVIPYAVGVDIGCRMALTIIDETDSFFKSNSHHLKLTLKEHTHFGKDGVPAFRREHEVLDDPLFSSTPMLRQLQQKAARQLGSSGSGNHFVEFGSLELFSDNYLGLPPRRYLALLSHSGSRGLGANIAQHYTQLAIDTCRLPKEAKQLAWLDLDSEAGQEYWLSMTLAGNYAAACHSCIHESIIGALGLSALATIENHHNFAWQEKDATGRDVIVHRKGATPAHTGEPGIIPGNMTDPAYLVTGMGATEALNSASHGAGRAMSRSKAKDSITVSDMNQLLDRIGVELIGGSVEEHPRAYKNIDDIMLAQKDLVKIEGRFLPKIVRMHKE